MAKSTDEKLIQKASDGIKEARRKAFVRLCICLTQKPREELDWFAILGKLFGLRIERQEAHLFFSDEKWNDANIDEKIGLYIGQLGREEKTYLVAFLIGTTDPMSLKKIEEIAGQPK